MNGEEGVAGRADGGVGGGGGVVVVRLVIFRGG